MHTHAFKKSEPTPGRKPPTEPLPAVAASPHSTREFTQQTSTCACGGGCPRCHGDSALQVKGYLDAPTDPLELEADRVADQVMRMADDSVSAGQAHSKATAAGVAHDPSDKLGTGEPLDSATRAFVEPRFGASFGDVRVHTDTRAAESARAFNARAYTVGQDIVFAEGDYQPATPHGRRRLAHELVHVLQQRAEGGSAFRLQRDADDRGGAQRPARTNRLRLDVFGADVAVTEPIAIMAARAVGADVRVSSLEDMINQLERRAAVSSCVESLTIWYHGSPEAQTVVGENWLGPPEHRYRLPSSGFTQEWLTLESNQQNLNRLRRLFCCGATMHWIGCGTRTVRAPGGLRSAEEAEADPGHIERNPDVYQSEEDARRHGATLLGAVFGRVNVQSWADATCTTIRSATDTVVLTPRSPTPMTIRSGGRWINHPPQPGHGCECDPATGRATGTAPTRESIVRDMQSQTGQSIPRDQMLWHLYLRTLRAYLPSRTDVVEAGSGGSQAQPVAEPGTLTGSIRAEIEGRHRPSVLRNYTYALRDLLEFAARDITPPSPLPSLPFAEHHPWLDFASTRAHHAAVTQAYLAVCYPDDYWRWILFNDRAVGETPEFTRSVILHELRHAADVWANFQRFQSMNGPPPPLPSDARERCRPVNVEVVRSWTDPWGQYVNRFVQFHQGQLAPERHLEIVAMQQQEGFQRWSAQERAYWVDLIFRQLPGDIMATTPLAAQQEVLRLFAEADRALQRVIARSAADVLREALGIPESGLSWTEPEPAGPEASSRSEQARARARTLLTHFEPIVDQAVREYFPILGRQSIERQLRARR